MASTRASHSRSRPQSTVSAASGSGSSFPSTKPLKRGQACINCRQLKIKCDGVKPICGSCTRNPRPDPCEYTDELANSRTRALEEEVSRLKSRIWELEHPGETRADGLRSSEVLLHDPYHPAASPSLLGQPQISPSSRGTPPIPPIPIKHQRSSSDPTDSPRSRGASPAQFTQVTNNVVGMIPLEKQNQLLEVFLSHSSKIGFFLNAQQYHNAINSSTPQQLSPYTSPMRTFTPPLLACALLWGAYLTRFAAERVLLEHALSVGATWGLDIPSNSLAVTPQQCLVEALQAHVLLANYLVRKDKFALARVQTSTATSLCFHHDLHHLRAPVIDGNRSSVPGIGQVSQEEYDELVTAFWSVFSLGKIMAITMDPPNTLCGAFEAPGIQIDTPWPIDTEMYGTRSAAPNPGNTVRRLLNEVPVANPYEFERLSKSAYYTKSVVLYHRAAYLAGQWHPALNPRDSQSYSKAFSTLDHILDGFRDYYLPSLFPAGEAAILTHALIQAATIVLHRQFFHKDAWSRQKCMMAANAAVSLFTQMPFSQMVCDNAFAIVWKDLSLILLEDLSRIRSLRANWQIQHLQQVEYQTPINPEELAREESDVLEMLRRITTLMTMFETRNALMHLHYEQVRNLM